MSVVVAVAMGVLALAVALALWQVRTATDAASVAVVGDLIFFSAIGLLLLLSIVRESSVILDAALLASFLGVLATLALARIITRGRR